MRASWDALTSPPKQDRRADLSIDPFVRPSPCMSLVSHQPNALITPRSISSRTNCTCDMSDFSHGTLRCVAVHEAYTESASMIISMATLDDSVPSRSCLAAAASSGPWTNSCTICLSRSPWSAASHSENNSDDHVLRVTFLTLLQTTSMTWPGPVVRT